MIKKGMVMGSRSFYTCCQSIITLPFIYKQAVQLEIRKE